MSVSGDNVHIEIHVEVQAESKCDSPVRHGRSGIEFGGTPKGTQCLFAIETEGQDQALIEEALRFGHFCGNGMAVAPEIREKSNRSCPGSFRLSESQRGKRKRQEYGHRKPHKASSKTSL